MYERFSIIYKTNDICIYDATQCKDPNIFILNSFKVKGYHDKIHLINIILAYSNAKNTNWKRTSQSMLVEFYIHNMAYCILSPFQKIPYIKKIVIRAKNTDFTLSDETKYNISSPIQFIRNMIQIVKE